MPANSRNEILAIAGDPGGAMALKPVLEHLHAQNEVRVRALAYREAVKLWDTASFPFTALQQHRDDQQIEDLAQDAALLFTGTSMLNGLDYEKRLIVLFHKLRRPSLVLLDYWSNYGRRFSDSEGRLAYLPDCIAALDAASRQGLIEAGVPADRIVVTGHPGLDTLAAVARAFSSQQRKQLRAELGVADDEQLVLFAAHPVFASDPSRRATEARQAAIDCLIQVLDRITAVSNARIALVIRPHPKESALPNPPQNGGSGVRIYWSRAGEARHAALAADAVTGVATMLLVEAYHMGCPTIAIQLAEESGDSAASMVPAATSEQALHDFLQPVLGVQRKARGVAHGTATFGGATSRVAALISAMLPAAIDKDAS